MICLKCGGKRIMHVNGKSSDCNSFSYKGKDYDYFYVPENIGIGGDDYIEFSYCLECGQIQGDFPVPDPTFYFENENNESEE